MNWGLTIKNKSILSEPQSWQEASCEQDWSKYSSSSGNHWQEKQQGFELSFQQPAVYLDMAPFSIW